MGTPARWSLRLRIVSASALVVVLLMLAGVVGFTRALDRILTQSAADAARVQSRQLAALITSGEFTAAQAVTQLPTQGAVIQAIDGTTGSVVAASDPAMATTPLTSSHAGVGTTAVTRVDQVGDEQDSYAMAVTGVRTPSGQIYRLVVASPLSVEAATVHSATWVLAAGAAALAVLLVVLIDLTVRRSLRPVRRIRAEVDRISHAGSAERLTVPPSADEIAQLAVTMNQMLDRLARADAAARRFVSDASHELRSPLATIRAAVETTPPEAATAETALLGTEVLRLQALVDDLLTLAKADDRGLRLEVGEVDLDDLVDTEVRRLRAVGQVPVEADINAVRVRGDVARLAQALRNLTDNAVRHTTGAVRVGVRRRGGQAILTVDNDGPPVPLEDRERVFERFTRLDDSRRRDGGGSGLGLAITRAIAVAHNGTVVAEEDPDGRCRFTLTLPLADSPRPS